MSASRVTLGTLFLIVFVDLVGFGMVIPFLPIWAARYHPSPLTLGLFMASYSTMQFLAAPLLGRLSDRFGRRPVLIYSLLGSIAGYLLLAVAHSLPLLFLSRIVDGISGGNIATAHAVIGDVTTPENRAKGMGIIGAAFGFGFIVGPALGGVLGQVQEWLPAVAAALLSLISLTLVVLRLPETRSPSAEPITRGLFALRPARGSAAHSALPLLYLMVFFLIAAFAAFEMTFALFLTERHHQSTRSIGMVLAGVGLVAAMVQGGLIGRLAKRYGERRLILAGALLAAISLGFLPYMPDLTALLIPLFLLAFGMGIISPSLAALTSRCAAPSELGQVLGTYQAWSSLARVVGPFLGGLAFSTVGATWNYRFTSLGMLLVALLAVALQRRRTEPAPL